MLLLRLSLCCAVIGIILLISITNHNSAQGMVCNLDPKTTYNGVDLIFSGHVIWKESSPYEWTTIKVQLKEDQMFKGVSNGTITVLWGADMSPEMSLVPLEIGKSYMIYAKHTEIGIVPLCTGIIPLTQDIINDVEFLSKSNHFILSPRQQIVSGVLPDNVQCFDGLVLVKKLSDNFPVCVKPDTAQKLVERGWGIILSQTENSQFISKENATRLFEQHYNYTNVKAISFGFLAFLKYNGTINGSPQFIFYSNYQSDAEPYGNGKVTIVFDNHNQFTKYLSNKFVDRHIWVVGFHSSLPIIYNFVDAKTGEFIGTWNTCTACV